MMKKLSLALACAGFGLSLTTGANANLISNGGFEGGVTNNGRDLPSDWQAWSAGIYGTYDVTGADGYLPGSQYEGLFSGVTAHSGNRFVGMGSYQDSFGGTQNGSIVTGVDLAPRTRYELSFWMLTDDRGYGVGFGDFGTNWRGRLPIEVWLGTQLLGVVAPNTRGLTWEQRTLSFVTGDQVLSSQLIIANGTDPFQQNFMHSAIDDVALVPEPGTLIALGLGAAALAKRRRNRSR